MSWSNYDGKKADDAYKLRYWFREVDEFKVFFLIQALFDIKDDYIYDKVMDLIKDSNFDAEHKKNYLDLVLIFKNKNLIA
jgi:hypothetical protein